MRYTGKYAISQQSEYEMNQVIATIANGTYQTKVNENVDKWCSRIRGRQALNDLRVGKSLYKVSEEIQQQERDRKKEYKDKKWKLFLYRALVVVAMCVWLEKIKNIVFK